MKRRQLFKWLGGLAAAALLPKLPDMSAEVGDYDPCYYEIVEETENTAGGQRWATWTEPTSDVEVVTFPALCQLKASEEIKAGDFVYYNGDGTVSLDKSGVLLGVSYRDSQDGLLSISIG